MKIIDTLDKAARESAVRANEISSEYSINTSTIIDKLIVVPLGTSSLLFTSVECSRSLRNASTSGCQKN